MDHSEMIQKQFSDYEKNLIIKAMSSQYFSAYYINIDKDEFREITASVYSRRELGKNGNSASAVEQFCGHIVVPEQFENMKNFVDMSTVTERMGDKDCLTEKYLSRFGAWCRAILIPVTRDENGKITNIIFATYTINDFVIQQLEAKKQIKDSTAIINALAIDYGSAYIADFDEDYIIPIRMSEDIEKEYGEFFKSKPSYDKAISIYINNTVYEKDREDMLKAVSGDNIKKNLATQDFFLYEFRASRNDKKKYYQMKVVKLSDNNGKRQAVIGFADVDSVRQRQLERYAYVDVLTGGDNYIRFKEKLNEKTEDGYFVSMNVRSFRLINSVCGVERGDAVIKKIWKVLEESIEENDLVAHNNADIFVMYVTRKSQEELEKFLAQIAEKIKCISSELGTPPTIPYFGVSLWHKEGQVEEIYSEATAAIKYSHDNKKCPVAFFNQKDTDRIMEEESMENAFWQALKDEEFEVWLQPKYNPGSDMIIGAEALTRWRKDDAYVFPSKFIPLFEQDGLIKILDEYVFEKICNWQATRLKEGKHLFPISINLSRASMYYTDVVDRYQNIVKKYGIAPIYIPLEITESAAIENEEVRELAENFFKAGFPLHMDDFGAGYSSLASLNAMNFETLKLDKSLIDYIGNYGGERLISHTISLAKELGMHVVAEGVEKQEQVTFLKELGCDGIQGYFYAKAMPENDFKRLIDN